MLTRCILVILVLSVNHCLGQIVDKIDIKLSKDAKEKQAIVVVMNEQANLSEVKNIKGKDAKAFFVYHKLVETASKSQVEIANFLNENQVSFQSFYITNMISLKADYQLIKTISMLPSVREVIGDGSFVMLKPEPSRESSGERTTIWNLDLIGAPAVWAKGYNGQNVVIGGQDTGYKWDVDAIKQKYKGWNGTVASHDYHWHDAITAIDVHNSGSNPCGLNLGTPCDDNNHGTHTMGTMVGDDGIGNQIGVAPGAKWIGCRNMERGWGTLSTYTECFQWFLAPYPFAGGAGDPTKMPHVINNSWGCPTSEGCSASNFAVMELALDNLRSAGCVIVVSAGNSGSGCGSVNTPAAIYNGAFSVGATNNLDAIAGFSSRGLVTVDGSNRIKPNICAPGVDIKSCLPNGSFVNWNGTSMAGPHVAGLVALIISANPALAGEVDKIEDIIEQTAINLTSGQTCGGVPGTNIPNPVFGYGRINALAAVDLALQDNYAPYTKVDKDVLINDSNSGFVLVGQNNVKYRLQVDNIGKLSLNSIPNLIANSTSILQGSLNFETNGAKLILTSPNGSRFALLIDNIGILTTSPVALLPTNLLRVNSGDLFVDLDKKGAVFRSPDGSCFLINITKAGSLITIPVDCP